MEEKVKKIITGISSSVSVSIMSRRLNLSAASIVFALRFFVRRFRVVSSFGFFLAAVLVLATAVFEGFGVVVFLGGTAACLADFFCSSAFCFVLASGLLSFSFLAVCASSLSSFPPRLDPLTLPPASLLSFPFLASSFSSRFPLVFLRGSSFSDSDSSALRFSGFDFASFFALRGSAFLNLTGGFFDLETAGSGFASSSASLRSKMKIKCISIVTELYLYFLA